LKHSRKPRYLKFKILKFRILKGKTVAKKLSSQLAKITRTQQANTKLIFATNETFADESELKLFRPVLE